MRKIFIILSLLVLAPILLLSQTSAPQNLRAELKDKYVELNWEKPANGNPVYYVIYRGFIPEQGVVDTSRIKFSIVGMTRELGYKDPIPQMMMPFNYALIYFVTAFDSARKESPRSNYAVVSLKPSSYVKIISEPPRYAFVGKLYTYQVVAVSSSGSKFFKYYLLKSPQGMTIDSLQGLVQWTPTSAGRFEVEILVVDTLGAKGYQHFSIYVFDSATGKVQGNAVDEDGNPVKNVLIKLYQKQPKHLTYKTLTGENGFFAFENILTGTYYARAIPLLNSNLEPQWYKDAKHLQEATPFEVKADSTVIINFVLKKKQGFDTTKFVVSGKVVDTSGAPIKNAIVVFLKAKIGTNKPDSSEEHNDWSEIVEHLSKFYSDSSVWMMARNYFGHFRDDVKFVAITDENGNYSALVKAGAYVVMCVAQGYAIQFWNGKTNILEADILDVKSDTTGINFKLTKEQLTFNRISGTVKDTVGNPVFSRLVAFGKKQGEMRRNIVRTVETDSLGFYEFTNLPDGCYIILAVPYGKYQPAFYSTAGGTSNWKEADTICVSSGANRDGIDIAVLPVSPNAEGLSQIRGRVRSRNVGLNGVLVIARLRTSSQLGKSTSAEQVAGYSITDANGYYSIENLAPGEYTVSAVKVDYETVSSNVIVSDYSTTDVTPSSADFDLVETPTSVENNATLPSSYELYQNYPNPFNPSTTIRYALPVHGYVTLKIYNILGQEIATLVSEEQAPGEYAVKFNAENLASGIYLYRLEVKSASGNIFTAIKKMVVLK